MSDRPLLAVLRPVSGVDQPAAQPLEIAEDSPLILVGRSAEADWQLGDPRVSRKHASIRVVGRAVLVKDLGSRHGTRVNGSLLAAGGEAPIRQGDTVHFGSLRCNVDQRERVSAAQTIADDPAQVTVLARESVGGLERSRLDSLIEAANRLASVSTREEAAGVLIESVTAIPECARACVLQPIGDQRFEPIAGSHAVATLTPSRSLLNAAMGGNLVRLTGASAPIDQSNSIIQMGVRSAVCAPIRSAGETDCLLYIDTREGERPIDTDAIAFCDAAAAIAGLAIERVRSEEMAERRRVNELDLRSARDAQQMLFPPTEGGSGGLDYVYRSIPGRHVGGDLFDLFTLEDGRTAFFLGDAVGKGAGAGVLMVATQTLLRGLLEIGHDLADAVTRTNRNLAARSEAHKFVTLIAGVWDPARHRLEMVDAGHGMGLINRGEGFEPFAVPGDIPLGISEATVYTAGPVDLGAGARIVVCSDGVAEQTDLDGQQFGIEGTTGALAGSGSPEDDVARIVDAVRAHAGSEFADDLTVASIGLRTDS